MKFSSEAKFDNNLTELDKFNTQKYNYNYQEIDYPTKQRISIILKLIGSNKKVLDIGCFNGYISEKIKQNNNIVYGVDNSKSSIEICKSKGIKCKLYNIEEGLPFNKEIFDVVHCGEIIEHIYNTDKLLKEINRVLTKDGYLVLTTPNLSSISRRLKLLLGKNPGLDTSTFNEEGSDLSVGHIRYFTPGSITILLNRNEFKIDKFCTDFIAFYKFRFTNVSRIFKTFGYTIIIKASKV